MSFGSWLRRAFTPPQPIRRAFTPPKSIRDFERVHLGGVFTKAGHVAADIGAGAASGLAFGNPIAAITGGVTGAVEGITAAVKGTSNAAAFGISAITGAVTTALTYKSAGQAGRAAKSETIGVPTRASTTLSESQLLATPTGLNLPLETGAAPIGGIVPGSISAPSFGAAFGETLSYQAPILKHEIYNGIGELYHTGAKYLGGLVAGVRELIPHRRPDYTPENQGGGYYSALPGYGGYGDYSSGSLIGNLLSAFGGGTHAPLPGGLSGGPTSEIAPSFSTTSETPATQPALAAIGAPPSGGSSAEGAAPLLAGVSWPLIALAVGVGVWAFWGQGKKK